VLSPYNPAHRLTVTPGTRLGPYEIIASLWAGGMGEVYTARDTRLDRTVAIKILPEAFAADADRVARFQREAKTLAALNHPNIAQIFGLDERAQLPHSDRGENRPTIREADSRPTRTPWLARLDFINRFGSPKSPITPKVGTRPSTRLAQPRGSFFLG
jgi:serine/threonine protein kinase